MHEITYVWIKCLLESNEFWPDQMANHNLCLNFSPRNILPYVTTTLSSTDSVVFSFDSKVIDVSSQKSITNT